MKIAAVHYIGPTYQSTVALGPMPCRKHPAHCSQASIHKQPALSSSSFLPAHKTLCPWDAIQTAQRRDVLRKPGGASNKRKAGVGAKGARSSKRGQRHGLPCQITWHGNPWHTSPGAPTVGRSILYCTEVGSRSSDEAQAAHALSLGPLASSLCHDTTKVRPRLE